MKKYLFPLLLSFLTFGVSCRKESIGNELVYNNQPVFFFKGTFGGTPLTIESGRNGYVATITEFATDRPGNGVVIADEAQFKTGSKLKGNSQQGMDAWLYLFLTPPSGDSIRVQEYPIGPPNPVPFIRDRAAVKIFDIRSGASFYSYDLRNTGVANQSVTITKIEPYDELAAFGVKYKKVSFRINAVLYNNPNASTLITRTLSGEGAMIVL
jgi:hypothetical protein